MNYNEKIDPIGESDIDHQEETDVLHDLTCNIYTDIENIKKELKTFNETIEEYETYTKNTFFVLKLKHQRNRLQSLIDNIETNYLKYENHVQ